MTEPLTLQADLEAFLKELGDEWEFAAMPDVNVLLKAYPVLEAHRLARAILEADGLVPDREPSWMRKIKRRFAQRYRADSISVATFADGG
jgi:hypothetical protein